MQKYTNAQIVAELKRVFQANQNKPFTRRTYERLGKISKTTVENRFGTWTDALKKAGLHSKFEKAKKVVKPVVKKKAAVATRTRSRRS